VSYSPCTACQRHLRNTERICPFCGHGVPNGRVRAAAPRGLKRAALVALGTSLTAAACGSDESSPSADVGQQQNNVPETTMSSPAGGDESTSGSSNGSGGDNSAGANGSGGNNESGEGNAGAAAQPTMGEGPMAMPSPPDVITVPVYGAPIPPEELPVGMAGAGGAPAMGGAGGVSGIGGSVSAGGVAGESAEADAGVKEDAGLVEPEGEGGKFQGQGGFQAQPLYGAVPAPLYGAVPAPDEN
jgi:hypothetical protein